MQRRTKTLLDYFSSPVKKKRSERSDEVTLSCNVATEENSSMFLSECSTTQENLPNREGPSSFLRERFEAPTASSPSKPFTSKNTKGDDRYPFLVDVRDKNGIRRGEAGYGGTTLYIPPESYEKFTPFEKQFWDIKKDHFDTVGFFRKGKFYELYEDDATIASKLFDLKVTGRVNMKMSGFPEAGFDHWASKFLEKGFKIARVDQSENMIGKTLRERSERASRKRAQRIR
jgi:DNA mismatch repair protein MSH6